MRYPPPGYYKDLVFPTRFLIPIRFNYSFAISCDVESNPEALIVIQRKQGKAVHGHVIKYGINPDAHLWFSLVDFIDAEVKDGLSFYCDMRKDGEKPNGFTLATVLKDCSMRTEIGFGEQVHVEVIKIGFFVDIFVGSSLVDLYAKCSEMDFANGAFLSVPEWIMQHLGVHCLMGDVQTLVNWGEKPSLCILRSSKLVLSLTNIKARQRKPRVILPNGHKGIRPNQFILASLVSAATDLGDQAYAESIHACICKYGFEYDNFTNNALLVMYMKLGSVQKGYISYRDLASWNALLSGFDDDATSHQGPRMFKQMLVEGFKPDMYTLLQHLRNFTCLSDVKLRKKDLLAWTAIISAYISSDEVYRAVNCFCQMQKEVLKPNEFALSSCLSGCSDLATQETRKQFHSWALKLGMARATHVASALVNMSKLTS
ncbi:hypothetical protein RHSIM_Rhsim05G0034000 [Rhododendron simsii]|uniref:Pentatricopeptide repeat-containing protein n=1 Tax=Rhododendron simsii TaxID=118357 RepID=A0A834LNN4_RHOSS|nr:hypothetical protein RHSIM_Rhsim05G0034000 [Rhododendron simsii]